MSTRSVRLLSTLFTRKVVLRKESLLNNVNKFRRCQQSRTLRTVAPLHAKVAFKLSDIGEGIREVAVKEWYVKEGDTVKQFDNICEVQSDKASVTITSRYDGVIKKLYYKVDETALVGQPLIDIETEEAETTNSTNEIPPAPPVKEALAQKVQTQMKTEQNARSFEQNTLSYKRELTIPSVRRLAKEHNLDLSQIRGTGKDGRILKEDVLNFVTATPQQSTSSIPTQSISIPQVIGQDHTEMIKGFRKAMVKTMTEALQIPTFVYSDEMTVTKLSKLRQEVKKDFLDLGVKISFMPFFIKAVSNALVKYPVLNATVDANCENITYKAAHNIGVAMDTKVGLAVPVIKNCQALTVGEIAVELNRLMIAGKQGTFSTSDLSGGTFAISNIGAIGGTYTKPIILPPQVAILAIGAAKLLPRFDDDMKVVAEEVVSLSGAADHRIVDGATMAHFCNMFKRQIEQPNRLFLNL